MTELLAILCGMVVGLSLGLTGGGGSLLAVPLLVYVLALDVSTAVPVSLIIVSLTASIGATHAIQRKMVPWQPVVTFAISGVLAAPAGIYLGGYLSEFLRITLFAVLAFALGIRMWRSAKSGAAIAVRADILEESQQLICRYSPEGVLRFTPRCAAALSVSGLATGILSGVFGVGGGFLIVPALMYVTQMGIQTAVASSLVIIALVGASGAATSFHTIFLAGSVVIWFCIGSSGGMLLGRRVARKLDANKLQKVFAALLMFVSFWILLQSMRGA